LLSPNVVTIVILHFEYLKVKGVLNSGSYLEGDRIYYCAVKLAYYRTARG
jgi:hypothetical protein